MLLVNAATTLADMTSTDNPSDVVARRVKEVRQARRLTVKQLAERCAETGFPGLSAQALYNLENGRRDKDGRRRRFVTVDELLALATTLNVAPVHLLVPTSGDEDEYQVTPAKTSTVEKVRAWVRGHISLGNGPRKEFTAEAPEGEWVSFDVTTREGALAAAEWAKRSGMGSVTPTGKNPARETGGDDG